MGIDIFKKQLMEMGFEPKERGNDCLSFSYKILCGKEEGRIIELGLHIPPQFPDIPPSGPHITPHLLPLNTNGGSHPLGGVHSSQNRHRDAFNATWQYWSRPFNGWASTDRSVKAYLRHINHLMDTL